jgi:hypothetical protein
MAVPMAQYSARDQAVRPTAHFRDYIHAKYQPSGSETRQQDNPKGLGRARESTPSALAIITREIAG